ncbi:hypothetical protein ACFX19_043412 [Malus domestica]
MNHSTESRSRRDSEPLNRIRVDMILDHSMESQSIMHIEPLNEIQAGYDSGPLNGIVDHKGFRTIQRNPSENLVSDHLTELSGSPRNIATLEE